MMDSCSVDPFVPSPEIVDEIVLNVPAVTEKQVRRMYDYFGEGFCDKDIAEELGVDVKLVTQVHRIVNRVHAHFGESYIRGLPSLAEIAERARAIKMAWSPEEERDRRYASPVPTAYYKGDSVRVKNKGEDAGCRYVLGGQDYEIPMDVDTSFIRQRSKVGAR